MNRVLPLEAAVLLQLEPVRRRAFVFRRRIVAAFALRARQYHQIARHMGSCINTMLQHYKHEIGMTPQFFLRRKRIEKACALLYDAERSIEQIAEETGFCDRYYFSKTFKKIQEMTPRQYRLQFEQQPARNQS